MRHDLEWVDSHCHLEMLKKSTGKSLEKSFQQGMRICITIGTDHKSNQKISEYCQQYRQVYGTYGIHPHHASNFKWSHLDWIKNEIQKDPKIVGIGECGYDLFHRFSKEKDQKEVFAAQLNLAAELQMPIVIHSRDAERVTLDMLESAKGKNLFGVFHSFTSTLELARYVLDAGFYISFNGICTFPNADSVRQVLKYTPLDRVLLETDAPFLSPEPLRSKPNIPGNVAIIGKYVADFLKIPLEEFSKQILKNTLSLFSRISYEHKSIAFRSPEGNPGISGNFTRA